MRATIGAFAATLVLLSFAAVPANAQATRTWVSGVGDDVNPCSRTAPCKTFAGAISKTATAGQISVLDSAGFGSVTITKSISLVSEGAEGSILACNTNGIVINSTTAIVNLQGLNLEGCGNGTNGIRILNAASVYIKRCTIRGFAANTATNWAIDITPTHASRVFISDCNIVANRRGINLQPSTGSAQVMLDRVHIDRNIDIGLKSQGASSVAWLNNNIISENGTGISRVSGGLVYSYGNNVIANNTVAGTPSQTLLLQ